MFDLRQGQIFLRLCGRQRHGRKSRQSENHVGNLMKQFDRVELTSFFWIKYVQRCAQRDCQPNLQIVVQGFKDSNKCRISEGAIKQFLGCERSHADMEGHAKNAWKDAVNWQTRKLNKCTKSPLHVWTSHQSNHDELETVGKVSKMCSQMVIEPDTLWSVNWLARAITK